MTGWTLALRSLQHHWRQHALVIAGAATGCAILTGALTVGDSVRHSLQAMALTRLGQTELALQLKERTVAAGLSDRLADSLHTVVAPVLHLAAGVVAPGGNGRANQVQVYGVDHRFWQLMEPQPANDVAAAGIILNVALAARLGVQEGETVLLRMAKPSPLPREALFSPEEDRSITLRLPVTAITRSSGPSRFSLRTDTLAPLNAFVPLARLQEAVDLAGQVNLLLVGSGNEPLTVQQADAALKETWRLGDAGLELRELKVQQALELRTRRVFLDPATARSAERAVAGATGVLTYLVSELRVGQRTTPYSMVAAVGTAREDAGTWPTASPTADLGDDEILLHPWTADDLQAGPGDQLRLTYLILKSMGKLEERHATFRIRGILPAGHVWWDRELMPLFPGLEGRADCSDWDPGFVIDLDRIRQKDEAFWDRYKGTPKALVTLQAGQRMWANRFGDLTAVRYPLHARVKEQAGRAIRAALDPASLGLFFRPVKAQALAAAGQAVNFGHLFLGFSFFLIVAALVLTALLFAFGVEQRAGEIGALLAMGFTRSRVRGLLMLEGAALALAGGILGAAGGTAYTHAALYGLTHIWQDAVSSVNITYHAEPATLLAGTLAGIGCAMLAIAISVRRQFNRPIRDSLAAGAANVSAPIPAAQAGSRAGLYLAAGAIAAAVSLLGVMTAGHGAPAPAAFFASGALLLIGGLGGCHWWLTRSDRAGDTGTLTLREFAHRNAARRRGRSLATVWMLACGSFLVVAVGANRHDPQSHARHLSSGTGGFALLGESTLPIVADLNSPAGRERAGFPASQLAGVSFVPLRVREGDDASCLSLNRAQVPRLLGVHPENLAGRFTFAQTIDKQQAGDHPWLLLNLPLNGGAIPAIGDHATVVWGLGTSLGRTIPFVNEAGQTIQLKIVGILADSMLQGSLLVAEDNLVKHFPSASGYRLLLIDTPPGREREVAQILGRALADQGMDLTLAAERLAMFKGVEHTYLSIFLALGGLGLLLGCAGLGVVLLRNVQERTGELALLRAVGFSNRLVLKLIVQEHWGLLLAGLACGGTAGLVAVLPGLAVPGAAVPYRSLAVLLGSVLGTGLLLTYLAGWLALRRPILATLRGE